jgi:hypothetical protein
MKPGNDLPVAGLRLSASVGYLGDERLAPGLGNLPDTPALSSFVSFDKVIVCSRPSALADVDEVAGMVSQRRMRMNLVRLNPASVVEDSCGPWATKRFLGTQRPSAACGYYDAKDQA